MDVLEPVKTMVRAALHIVHHMVQALYYLYDRTGCPEFASADTFIERFRAYVLQAACRMIGKDKICAVVAAADARSMWTAARRALRVTRTIELRLDWLSNDAEMDRFLRCGWRGVGRARLLIATCRRREAGGKFRGHDCAAAGAPDRGDPCRLRLVRSRNRDIIEVSAGIAGCAARRRAADRFGAFFWAHTQGICSALRLNWLRPARSDQDCGSM